MPAVSSWDPPFKFYLTNPYNSTMTFNEQGADGLYLLDRTACKFTISVRSTSDNVPQSDGSILHHRFLTGAQMVLAIILMETEDKIACDEGLLTMLDDLTGAFRSLLNAGDNEGRLAWDIPGGGETRMLDDVRLLVYPDFDSAGVLPRVTVTIDSQYPYAQDLTEATPNSVANGATEALDNTGTANYFPVFKVNGPTSGFTIENLSTGDQFVYDAALPGAPSIASGHYAEIDTFRNTVFLDGNGANLKAGVDQLNSDYFSLRTGTNNIKIDGAGMDVLWAPAYG